MTVLQIRIADNDISSWVIGCGMIPIILRARNYKPSFNGFNISISSVVPNEPLIGDRITVLISSNRHYMGFVSKKDFNEEQSSWELEITHFLFQLEQYRVRPADLHSDLISRSINSDATWNSFTVNTLTDVITKTAHGLSTGDKILFRNQTGNLPAPLVENNFYYVYVVDADNFKVFEDYAMYIEDTAWAGGDGSHGYVNITDTGTGSPEYTTDFDQSKYNDWSFYRDIAYAKNLADNQFFSRLIPGNSIYPMQLKYSENPDDEWNLIMFDCDDGGSLPTPLSKNRGYIAAYDSQDNWFLVYTTRANYVADISLATSDIGSGDQWFQTIRRKSGDSDVWTNYPTAIIQLKHLIETIFWKIGVTLDTTNIDGEIFYRYTTPTQSYEWTHIYFMESLLYNINQSTPMNPDDADIQSQVTCLDLILDLFQRFGLTIKFTGADDSDLTFKLYSQIRDEFGMIDPANEPQWSIADDNQTDYRLTDIYDDKRGWINNNPLVSVFQQEGLAFVSNQKKHEEFQGYLKTYDRLKEGEYAQQEDVGTYLNLVFFLVDKFATNGPYAVYMIRDGAVLDGKELLVNPNYSPSENALSINGRYALMNHTREEIEFKAELFDQGIYTVKEIYLDVKKQRIKLIQEINAEA